MHAIAFIVMLDLDPDRTALFLDFDGTLVDIAPRPDAVLVPETLPLLLMRVHRRFGHAVAVVSGRPVAELDRFLAPARLPAAGLHGLEWRIDAGTERETPPAALETVRRAIAASGIVERGARLEDKGLSLALHFREAPHLGDDILTLAREWAAPYPDLAILHGKMVVEIKPAWASKASAVQRFSAAPPFVGRRPVFVGDDVTDEDGMRAALQAGGAAIKVGPGASVAPFRLDAPTDVHRWLSELIEE